MTARLIAAGLMEPTDSDAGDSTRTTAGKTDIGDEAAEIPRELADIGSSPPDVSRKTAARQNDLDVALTNTTRGLAATAGDITGRITASLEELVTSFKAMSKHMESLDAKIGTILERLEKLVSLLLLTCSRGYGLTPLSSRRTPPSRRAASSRRMPGSS